MERKLDAYRTEPGAQPLEKRQKWNRIPLVEAMRRGGSILPGFGQESIVTQKYTMCERQKRGENYRSLLTDLPS